jgi:hypothetical protein
LQLEMRGSVQNLVYRIIENFILKLFLLYLFSLVPLIHY